jgi:hypothetical protein
MRGCCWMRCGWMVGLATVGMGVVLVTVEAAVSGQGIVGFHMLAA